MCDINLGVCKYLPKGYIVGTTPDYLKILLVHSGDKIFLMSDDFPPHHLHAC